MTRPHLIRVSSTALGHPARIRTYIYDTLDDMREAASQFSGETITHAYAVTQAWSDDTGRAGTVIIRLAAGYINAHVVSHEVHHATTAIYGAHVGDRIQRTAHLNHHNEPFAHLYSDLYTALTERLHTLGYA